MFVQSGSKRKVSSRTGTPAALIQHLTKTTSSLLGKLRVCVPAENVHNHTGCHGVGWAGGMHLVLPSASDESLSDPSPIALLIQGDRRGYAGGSEPHSPVAGLPPSLISEGPARTRPATDCFGRSG